MGDGPEGRPDDTDSPLRTAAGGHEGENRQDVRRRAHQHNRGPPGAALCAAGAQGRGEAPRGLRVSASCDRRRTRPGLHTLAPLQTPEVPLLRQTSGTGQPTRMSWNSTRAQAKGHRWSRHSMRTATACGAGFLVSWRCWTGPVTRHLNRKPHHQLSTADGKNVVPDVWRCWIRAVPQ